MKARTLECGCKQTETVWIALCPRHAAETRELHERVAREHRAAVASRDAKHDELAQ